ncbi:putative Zn-dependent protease [Cytobacillus eiseniae]|uniref:Zn-dependent protease n=1 Tax=Cytobacillus eiseniae TaxID=762947 RepID=A0ABS4RF83_9BACI|nr:matrixin family metalloprotease [Cytobacillus eiseniae]MBP2241569.1 putative Zn-dependent protease [Cytobacillus eiseniae]
MKKWFTIATSLIFIISLLSVPNQASGHFNTTGKKWNAGYVNFYINNSSLPTTFDTPITSAMRTWFNQIPMNTQRQYSTSAGIHFEYSRASSHFPNDEIAVAIVSGTGNTIESVRILFNQNMTWTTSSSGSGYHIQTVALHEIGHALGLDHVGWSLIPDTRNHVMYYTYTDVKTSLHSHDIEGIKSIY